MKVYFALLSIWPSSTTIYQLGIVISNCAEEEEEEIKLNQHNVHIFILELSKNHRKFNSAAIHLLPWFCLSCLRIKDHPEHCNATATRRRLKDHRIIDRFFHPKSLLLSCLLISQWTCWTGNIIIIKVVKQMCILFGRLRCRCGWSS